MTRLEAHHLPYREVNDRLRALIAAGEKEIEVHGVNGHRYLAAGMTGREVTLKLYGVAGNDLACFMGPGIHVEVVGNAQDGAGNTMGAGRVVVRGHAGDIVGYAMRGGKIFVQTGVGYRVGIHMKAYRERVPVIVIGGRAGAFLGEYMAGGVIIVLGLERRGGSPVGSFLGTGMHGGVIYVRGGLDPRFLGQGAVIKELEEEDRRVLDTHLAEYASFFGLDHRSLLAEEFVKVVPRSHRPYGTLYAY
ncbi:MAG: hypothetical protein QHH27_10430 [Clostridia bacterium]|nr:hypothetical protein [Clostridia bacterium]MDH7573938.1 hypothetical protein [Clostridia bacterium]